MKQLVLLVSGMHKLLGYVHRDLHLGNFVVDSEMVVHIVDWGCAKPTEGQEDMKGDWSVKFSHMAPETIKEGIWDAYASTCEDWWVGHGLQGGWI
jgi:tRNA A-37 threonylcarbamoyl transferase component Bud32